MGFEAWRFELCVISVLVMAAGRNGMKTKPISPENCSQTKKRKTFCSTIFQDLSRSQSRLSKKICKLHPTLL
jgi:hypothetical protein